MYVCMYVRMYVCMCKKACSCMLMLLCVFLGVCMRAYMHVCFWECVRVHICTCAFEVRVRAYMYVCTYRRIVTKRAEEAPRMLSRCQFPLPALIAVPKVSACPWASLSFMTASYVSTKYHRSEPIWKEEPWFMRILQQQEIRNKIRFGASE